MSDRTPPTADDLLDLCSRTMDPGYWAMVEGDPYGLGAVFRAIAEMFAYLARRDHAMAMSAFFLPWGDDEESVATFAARSTCDVVIERTADTWRGLTMPAGSVWLVGPQVRRYRNAAPIVWPPYGDAEQTVTFEAEYVGWTYDLDFMADENGDITEPQVEPRVVWRERIDLQDESLRAGTDATIAIPAGQRATLTDVGGGDVFNAGDVGRYVRITEAADPANVGRVLQILAHTRAAETPAGSGLRPNTVTLDDAAEPSVLQAAVADDGGVLTVETGGPYTLLPGVPVAGDAYYFGLHVPFVRLDLDISTAATGDLVVVWERWDGAAWTAFDVLTDGTIGFAQGGRVEWTIPAAWSSTAVDGIAAYWVRARVDSAAGATGAEASAVYAGVPFGLVAEVGSVSWSVLRWQDLGFALARVQAPTGGRDNTLAMLGAERQVYPVAGETADAFRQRAARMIESVSPVALHSALNRVLGEYGLRGRVMDVQTDGLGGPGYKGMFFDTPAEWAPEWVSAFDLYVPGDVFPIDDTMLPIATWQATRHFWVFVPPVGLGDFGMAFDDGPVFMLPDGTFIGSAFDSAALDGYAIIARALYRTAYEALQRLKLGGVAMTFVRDETLLLPC